jgi:hypothetical protein
MSDQESFELIREQRIEELNTMALCTGISRLVQNCFP